MPVSVTRASNNYGPYQFPEKLIPLMISNALEDKPLPVYGDGSRCATGCMWTIIAAAILAVLEKGATGEIYNIGGNRSLPNLEVVQRILRGDGQARDPDHAVTDRPGHDRRYALSSEKLMRETGWAAADGFRAACAPPSTGTRKISDWVARVKSGEYRQFYELNYVGRES